MVRIHKGHILTEKGALALECHREALGRKAGQGFLHERAGLELVGAVSAAHVVGVGTEEIQHLEKERLEAGVRVRVPDFFEHAFGLLFAAGVPLQQAVVTLLEADPDLGAQGDGAFEQRLEFRCAELFAQGEQLGPLGRGDFHGAVDVSFECVEALIVPAGVDLFLSTGQIRNVDGDGGSLSNPVKPSDPLFEKFRIGGQVEEHQIVGKLEVAPFAADLRADEQASPFGFCKEGGVAVTLGEGETLVKEAAAHVDFTQQFRVDPLCKGLAFADDERLKIRVFPQKVREPFNLKLHRPFSFGRLELVEMGFPFGKAREGRARVAEHHPARTEGVQQGVD